MIRRSGAINVIIIIIAFVFLMLSSSAAFARESSIILIPNRFVVLDDPNSGTKAPGFFNPTEVRGGSWNSNYWYGESTTIRAIAQVLNDSGHPQSGTTVTFTLRNPANAIKNTAQSTTDSKGTAYYSFDLNEQRYWGYWTVEASAVVEGGSINSNTSFALNWWGCAQCHGKEDPGKWGTRYTPKSYYTMGYDFHKSQTKSKHTDAMAKGTCIICHQMYNGTPVNWGFRDNSPNINPDNEYSPDWHYGRAKCQNCHAGSNISTTPQGKNPETAGCYDTEGCHAKKNNNLTGVSSTTGYAVGGNYRTNYSYIPANTVKAHNSSAIPCIVCHNAGHKITKPYNTTSTSNTFTEYQQCIACHQTYARHNDSVSCTVCHSQDAHAIKVFSQSATYVTGKTNPERGNCTGCHQNSTFLDTLKAQPMAGSYTVDVPQIPSPLNHSTNPYSGALWNGTQPAYWDNTSQMSACNYCHGASVIHSNSALGNISRVKGTNNLNQDIAGGTWCANCHYANAAGYAGDQFSPQPPEISNMSGLVPATASDGTAFYNHSDALAAGYDDAKCKSCHGLALSGYSETSLNFSHSVSAGGGESCIECHGTDYPGASPSVSQTFVNITAFGESIHQNINAAPPDTVTNDDCWSCHYNKDMSRQNIRKCSDCHRKLQQWHGNANITANFAHLW
ncbi:hypothetical protein ANME2D_02837 [Candidatus Methanoperedens nitroreducens]|uniref:Uncharacterized protein n=1 Tax=Candidatus Methanoperedens nitratireducens TaxID=1392998 RepID=A0A062V092_9EURY|nr:hypothetical protein [Candidatus Methanoperedens nitroreducens]KCZ70812.1 hypothetical protein ANME2D_02837 [Candidatus Methanoperedens nitroreducens]MDJ1420666.1 hypothetical protein [Candidatus Methanoperedens sp.]